MKRGDHVMANQTHPAGAREPAVTQGSSYTVNSVSGDGKYLHILGDDDRGHHLLHTLFSKLSP
jgi:hypothetical protein